MIHDFYDTAVDKKLLDWNTTDNVEHTLYRFGNEDIGDFEYYIHDQYFEFTPSEEDEMGWNKNLVEEIIYPMTKDELIEMLAVPCVIDIFGFEGIVKRPFNITIDKKHIAVQLNIHNNTMISESEDGHGIKVTFN